MNRQDILDLLIKKDGLDVHEIADALKMEDTSSFIALNRELNDLERDNDIFFGDDEKYYIVDDRKIKKGTVIIKRNNNAYIDDDEGLFEIRSNDLKGAMNKDVVLYARYGHYARILKIISHYSSAVVGLIRIRKGKIEFYADDIRMKDFKITNLKNFKLKDRMKVRCIITNYIKKEMILESIITYLDDPRSRELSILYSYNVPMEFTSTALNECKTFKKYIDVKDYPKRADLTSELVMTIDGDDSKDFDDAISVYRQGEDYLLKVHIADVSEYVKENSALDKNARDRATSIYYADRVIPMLPLELSNGLCSLNPGVNRLTITAEMVYDRFGNQLDFKVYESVIKSKYRMTYNNVNKIFDGDETLRKEYSELLDMLDAGYELSSILRKRREDNGSIDFKDDEAKLIIKNDKVYDIVLRERGIAEKMIEDFMIGANVAVASYMKYLDYPMIYRNHDYPKTDRLLSFVEVVEQMGYKFKGNKYAIRSKQLRECLEYFEGSDLELVVSNLMLRSMAKAVYDNVPEGHYGLGLEDYCHFTSPIRRYPDLVVHRMLKKYVFSYDHLDDKDKDIKKNGEIANLASDRERRAVNIERDIMDLKRCEYMADKVGKIYDGVISSVLSFGFFVKLDNTVEGLVHVSELDGYYTFDEKMMVLRSDNQEYKVGMRVRVKVSDVDLRRCSIDFRLYNKRRKRIGF